MLYVGGWDAAEDIAGLQAAGVRSLEYFLTRNETFLKNCISGGFWDFSPNW